MYQVLNAKIAAIYGKTLSKEDYKSLIDVETPADIAGYLKNHTEYKDF